MSDVKRAGLEKAVDALQQLHGEYASLEQMQRDAWFIAEPLIAAELRKQAATLEAEDISVHVSEWYDAADEIAGRLERRAYELDSDDVDD